MSGIIPTDLVTPKENDLVVVALDIGTSFSGFSFLTRHDFKINPLKVHCKQWTVGELGTLYKTKTIILLNKDKKYVEFGYDAEIKYMAMKEEEANMHYYCRDFKMALHSDEGIMKNMKIKDKKGKRIPAHTVFAESVRYLKDTAIKELTKSSVITEEDIKWVVTLPAIWSESAKQFMILACKEAGINEAQLEISLEPESAALCCNYLAIERGDNSLSLRTFENGRQFMVLDLGGGTVDITAFEVYSIGDKNALKEIYKATGGPWGGIKVDEAFEDFWKKVLELPKWEELQKTYKDEIAELFSRFEIQKRNFKDRDNISLTLPECIRELTGLGDIITNNFEDEVDVKRGKITFTARLFSSFYEVSVTNLVALVNDLLSKEELSNISAVLMVGGFSESFVIQKAIKDTVGERAKVYIPTDPGSVILKGAAIYGFAPDIIMERVIRYTYGISTRKPFDKTTDSPDPPHYHKIEGNEYIEDIFYPFVRVNDVVIPGFEKAHTFNTIALNSQGALEIEIYASKERDPKYTNDPSHSGQGMTFKIGCVQFPRVDKMNLGKKVTVTMKFGYTNLTISAKLETGETIDCHLNLLK